MPKLYEYFGLVIYFYAREHLPVHVHGKHQGRESKAEISMRNGEVWQIKFTDVAGRPPLTGKKLDEFKRLVGLKSAEIVSRWTDFFVFHRQIKPEIITRRIK
jgi:hypothetical protein